MTGIKLKQSASGKDAVERREEASQVSPLSPLRPDWSPRHTTAPRTVAEAIDLQSRAIQKRAIADGLAQEPGDTTGGGVFERAEAAAMEKQAQAYFDLASHATGPVTVGNGGEFVVPTKEAWQSIPGVICTVRDTPDMLTATASRQRLELTGNSLPMAVDAAESIGAKNSLERMLAHELAAAHRLSGEVQGASVDGLGLERQVSRLCRAAVKAVQDMRGGDHAQARIVVLQSVGQRLDRWRR